MHKKLTEHKAYHRRLVKRRSATIEPVLGTLINYHCMRRLNTRGMAQANKHVLMATLTYNLKKYLKCIRRNPIVKAQPVPILREDIQRELCGLLQTILYKAIQAKISLTNFHYFLFNKKYTLA